MKSSDINKQTWRPKAHVQRRRASRRNLYTYSGHISFPDAAPTLYDIAISLCREGRYAGAGMCWWPVGLHTFVVCDMLPDQIKIHGLMHDASETITGDVPKPVKTRKIELLEEQLTRKIYEYHHLPKMTARDKALVHEADQKALHGEVYTVGTQALQAVYPRCPEAEALVVHYLEKFPPLECLSPGGRAPVEFLRRYREYLDLYNRLR